MSLILTELQHCPTLPRRPVAEFESKKCRALQVVLCLREHHHPGVCRDERVGEVMACVLREELGSGYMIYVYVPTPTCSVFSTRMNPHIPLCCVFRLSQNQQAVIPPPRRALILVLSNIHCAKELEKKDARTDIYFRK